MMAQPDEASIRKDPDLTVWSLTKAAIDDYHANAQDCFSLNRWKEFAVMPLIGVPARVAKR